MTPDAPAEQHRVTCHLDRVLAEQGMTLAELSRRVQPYAPGQA